MVEVEEVRNKIRILGGVVAWEDERKPFSVALVGGWKIPSCDFRYTKTNRLWGSMCPWSSLLKQWVLVRGEKEPCSLRPERDLGEAFRKCEELRGRGGR